MKSLISLYAIPIICAALGQGSYAQPLTYSPNPVNCGTACETRTNLGWVTITNTSSDQYSLHLTAFTHSGPFCLGNATEWVVLNPAGQFGNSYAAEVYFNGFSCSASGIGVHNGSVTIPYHLDSDDPPVGQLTINCTGQMIGVIELTTTPEHVNFDNVFIGATQTRDIVVHNAGEAAATIHALDWENDPSGAFSADQGVPFSISPGSQRTITLRFAPTFEGAYNAWLIIRYQDCGGSQATSGAGCAGNGIVSTGTDNDSPVANPGEFGVTSVYPNPFNTQASIHYTLVNGANVRLSLFNVLGEEVALLASGWKTRGEHSVAFDAGDLPTGLYLVRLQSASQVSIRRVLLLK